MAVPAVRLTRGRDHMNPGTGKPTFTSRITELKALRNSRAGNPRYAVRFEGRLGIYITQTDSAVNYGIDNAEMRSDVDVWLTTNDRIAYMSPSRAAS